MYSSNRRPHGGAPSTSGRWCSSVSAEGRSRRRTDSCARRSSRMPSSKRQLGASSRAAGSSSKASWRSTGACRMWRPRLWRIPAWTSHRGRTLPTRSQSARWLQGRHRSSSGVPRTPPPAVVLQTASLSRHRSHHRQRARARTCGRWAWRRHGSQYRLPLPPASAPACPFLVREKAHRRRCCRLSMQLCQTLLGVAHRLRKVSIHRRLRHRVCAC
mmetsp:Transcript_116749/g.376804  ORF Transcript_116749/g.376804 Transcript_116749/m.376804 type:complete len:215 (+) Transcript_116749:481-1125(+)